MNTSIPRTNSHRKHVVVFIFICKPKCSFPDSNFRDLLFEVSVNSEIINRFNTSHEFWEKFCGRNKSLKKARLL